MAIRTKVQATARTLPAAQGREVVEFLEQALAQLAYRFKVDSRGTRIYTSLAGLLGCG